MGDAQYTNRLAGETSPYLLQHAHNPVDWYPWCDEALDRARRENKPILLSIGYSACHWCHVMEHESFEDPETAEVLNALFVNIKVDREERPDLDKIYQTAHQLLVQRPGGWPLNMFLDPRDRMPIFGGTYFPRAPRHGLPAFVDLCRRVADFYREHQTEIDRQSSSLAEVFKRIEGAEQQPTAEADEDVLAQARDELAERFDARHGGFGGAPKFPHPTTLDRLIRHWADSVLDGSPDAHALHMARYTLSAMAGGGMFDQVGGGFCRYSVDDMWMIPHFEKMLYDNGQLLCLYADAATVTGDDAFARVAAATGEWVMREMQSPAGGYYSTLDADSEGEEGKYYAWTREELRGLLDEDTWAVMVRRFGLDGEPNFEGKWHLHTRDSIDAIATRLDRGPAQVTEILDRALGKLFAARQQRTPPGRDEKILTSWNGLMIKGMARAGRLIDRPDFIDSAQRAFDFIRTELWRDGRLLATSKDGSTRLNAYLDDYAFLIDGGLELLQARWRDGDLDFLVQLAEVLLARFADPERGGFFFTSDDHETLLFRPKPDADEATPSGNGVAALALLRLGHLLGESRYLEAADGAVAAFRAQIARYPSAYCSLLNVVEEQLKPTQTIVLRGDADALVAWQRRCHQRYAPRRLAVAIPTQAGGLIGILAERGTRGDGVTAYVCSGHRCAAPITEFTELETALATEEIQSEGSALNGA